MYKSSRKTKFYKCLEYICINNSHGYSARAFVRFEENLISLKGEHIDGCENNIPKGLQNDKRMVKVSNKTYKNFYFFQNDNYNTFFESFQFSPLKFSTFEFDYKNDDINSFG